MVSALSNMYVKVGCSRIWQEFVVAKLSLRKRIELRIKMFGGILENISVDSLNIQSFFNLSRTEPKNTKSSSKLSSVYIAVS